MNNVFYKDLIYKETYCLVVDEIALRFLVGLTAYESLDLYHMGVVKTHLYESIDDVIYKRILEGFNFKHINQIPKNCIW